MAQDLKYRMIRYMGVEGRAATTIALYSKIYDQIKQKCGDLDTKDSAYWIDYLATIPSPTKRNNARSVILKAVRDVLGYKIRIPKIYRPVKLQPVYTIEEVTKIFARIKNPKHRAIAQLLFTESMRINEVLSIKLADCNKAEGAIIIRATKNGKDYKKYLDPSTITALHNYLVWAKGHGELPKQLLFEGWGHEKYSDTSVRMFLKKAHRLAGIKPKGACHIFRRSASVWKIENGWTANHIAGSLNNSIGTVNKYYALARPEYISTLQKPVAMQTTGE